MATEILNEGATSFADGNWSNDGIDAADDMLIDKPFGVVTAGLDWSGITGGIESFDITAGATSGTIGAANTPLIIDVDNSADAFFRVMGNVTVYLDAGGDSSQCNVLHIGAGTTYLIGGTFTDITVAGGTLVVEEAAVIDGSIKVTGGSVTIKYNSTACPLIRHFGGIINNRRPYTVAHISNAAVFNDDRETGTGATIYQHGGTRKVIRGNTTNDFAYAGTLDNAGALEAVTLGSSSGESLATLRVIPSDKVDITGLARPNAYQSAGLGV